MKKKIIFLISGLVIVGLIVFLIFKFSDIKVGIERLSKERDLKPGEFELVKMTNGGVPYKWEVSTSNKNVKCVGMYSVALNDAEGGPVEEHYIFKGVKKGTTIITFKYVSVVDNKEEKDRRSSFTIEVNDKLISTIKD